MLKKMKHLTGLTAVLLAVASVFLFSGKVYAGDSLSDCGDNLNTGYSDSAHAIYIEVDDKNKDVTDNTMYNYGEVAPPWGEKLTDINYVYIGEGVYSIGDNAFEGMTNLLKVFIPASVKKIGPNAFKKCDSVSRVFYGGTQEQWDALVENNNITSESGNGVLLSTVDVMNRGELILDYTSSTPKIIGPDMLAIQTTMSYFDKVGRIKKFDSEPKTAYDLDVDSVDDFVLKVTGYLEAQLDYQTASSLKNYYSIYTLTQLEDKSFYEYAYRDISIVYTNDLYYFDKVVFKFSEPDFGSISLDLSNGEKVVTGSEKDDLFSFFNTAVQGYMLYDAEPIIGYGLDTEGNEYYDLNRDGKDDIKVEYDGTQTKYINLGNLTEDKTIKLSQGFIDFLWDYSTSGYFSSLEVKAKVTIEKVDEVPATCENKGTKEHWKAKETGYLYADAEGKNKIEAPEAIPELGHDWGEWKTVKEATVDQEGLEERVCKRDASHKETRAIPKVTPSPSPTPALPVEPTVEPTPSTSPEERAKQMGEDGTAFSKGASDVAAEAAITSYSSEKDPKGTAFGLLQAKASKVTKNSIKLAWNKSSEAKSYVIYGNKCGTKNKYEKLTTITGSSYTAKKVAGNKVKKGTYYKFLIVALDKDGNVISTSKTIHAATIGGKVGNDKKVTTKAKKNKVSLKAGKTFKLKAKTKAASKKLKVKKHRAVAYESSDTSVATVSSKGVIKAVGKGECEVYAYAQNGVSVKIKVKVK